MAGNQANGAKTRDIDQFAGSTRFEIELEFVQMLGNPHYLQHLAAAKLLDDADFVRYLDYLQYFKEPAYLKYLRYPGPTLRALECLQQERFRREILAPAVVEAVREQGLEAATTGFATWGPSN